MFSLQRHEYLGAYVELLATTLQQQELEDTCPAAGKHLHQLERAAANLIETGNVESFHKV